MVVLAALLGGWVIARSSREEPRPPEPDDVDELLADAEAVRTAAERAAEAADEARHRAESAARASAEAEQRYLAAQWVTRDDQTKNRLVQRAALDAYRRGDLDVTQLNTIWEHAGAVEMDEQEVYAARAEYDRTLAETAQVRQEAHVAEVAAEVLAEETRIVEQDVLDAHADARSGLDGLLKDS